MGNFITKHYLVIVIFYGSLKIKVELLACFYNISNKYIYTDKMLFGSTGNITLITLVCLVKNLELATVYLKFLHALNFFWRDRYFIRDKFVKVLSSNQTTKLKCCANLHIFEGLICHFTSTILFFLK